MRLVRWERCVAPVVFWLSSCAPSSAQDAPGFRIVGPSFLAIQTSDVEAASAWYRRVLNLEEVSRVEAPDGRYSITILSGEQLSVELIRSSQSMPAIGVDHGLFKAGLFVDDVEAAHRWLRANGVDTDAAIFTDEALNARTFVFRDPDGNRIQVFQRCLSECVGQS